LSLLQEYSRRERIGCEAVCVNREEWGTGEPGDVPFGGKKPVPALNELLRNRLPVAEKIFNEQGKDVYHPQAKALCSDFRIIMEKMVEAELLGDIVRRDRRDVQTKGKIRRLALISAEDCALFDDLMTKYSQYEHSQSEEAPVSLPFPDELRDDFRLLKGWHEGFVARSG
jgi:hypothetical protein